MVTKSVPAVFLVATFGVLFLSGYVPRVGARWSSEMFKNKGGSDGPNVEERVWQSSYYRRGRPSVSSAPSSRSRPWSSPKASKPSLMDEIAAEAQGNREGEREVVTSTPAARNETTTRTTDPPAPSIRPGPAWTPRWRENGNSGSRQRMSPPPASDDIWTPSFSERGEKQAQKSNGSSSLTTPDLDDPDSFPKIEGTSPRPGERSFYKSSRHEESFNWEGVGSPNDTENSQQPPIQSRQFQGNSASPSYFNRARFPQNSGPYQSQPSGMGKGFWF